MRRFLLLVLLLTSLAGCGDAPLAKQEQETTPIRAATPPSHPLPIPTFDHLYNLGILRASSSVRVGMSWDEAIAVFGEPPGSYEKSDLPPCVTQPDGNQPYEARGWQAKDEGFGAILYKGRVTVAMHQLDQVTEDRLNEVVTQCTNEFGSPHVYDRQGKSMDGTMPGTNVRYWFWQSGSSLDPGDQYLMVCATQIVPGKFDVTTAIGWIPLMDAFGMTPQWATSEQRPAELDIAKEQAAKRRNPANSSNQSAS